MIFSRPTLRKEVCQQGESPRGERRKRGTSTHKAPATMKRTLVVSTSVDSRAAGSRTSGSAPASVLLSSASCSTSDSPPEGKERERGRTSSSPPERAKHAAAAASPAARVAVLAHVDDGALEHLEQCLLHALAADVSRGTSCGRNLVDLVDEDDAAWGRSRVSVHGSGDEAHLLLTRGGEGVDAPSSRTLDVAICRLDEPRNAVLDILADIP